MNKKRLAFALLLCAILSVPVQGATKKYIDKEINNTIKSGNGSVASATSIDKLDVNSSKFSNNEATYKSSSYPGDGGVFYVRSLNSSFNAGQIVDSYFSSNKAAGSGGAVEIKQGTLTISGSEFVSNKAGTNGGAINVSLGKLISNSNIFSFNESVGDGGAISTLNQNITVDNNTFTSNKAGRDGGAIFLGKGSATITNSTFTSNSATVGGAIYNTLKSTSYKTKIDNVIFNENKAETAGAIFNLAEMTVTNSEFNNNKSSDTASINGGGAMFLGSESVTTLDNVKFFGNTSESNGGAIATRSLSNDNHEAVLNIKNTTFTSNTAKKDGGAIENNFLNSSVENSSFVSNTATGNGGAVYNGGKDSSGAISTLNVNEGTTFSGNSAENGGAIFSDGNINTSGASFVNNSANGYGGAITLRHGTLNVDGNTSFTGNSAAAGGAIASYTNSDVSSIIKNATFLNNEATLTGGAIASYRDLTIENVTFSGNKVTTSVPGVDGSDGGGALFLGSLSTTTIKNANFINNSSEVQGGAIATRNPAYGNNSAASLDVSGTNFEGNSSKSDGGAVYSAFNGASFTDSSFVNNSSEGSGGAIYSTTDTIIKADQKDVIFSGNTASDGSDIFMSNVGTLLTFDAASGKTISVNGGISGATDAAGNSGFNMNVNGQGNFNVNSYIKNAVVNVNDTASLIYGSNAVLNNSTLTMNDGTTLNTANNVIDNFAPNTLNINGNVNLVADIDLGTGSADNFSNANITSGSQISVTEINAIGNTTANNVSFDIAQALGIDPANLSISSALLSQTQRVLTPIRYLQGVVSQNGVVSFAPAGNGYKDFNPAVMASPIAAQVGGYLTQLNSYDQAFRNMDMYMLMTAKERQALKMQNKYAAADGNLVFDPINTPYSDKAVWFRPYSTFENVPLKGGPRVSNVSYGSFFGGDSELYDLGNGWDGMYSIYVGYNGSHQAYNSVGIYQNGGTLGATGMAYKGNFFTGLTVNVGANGGEASTMYGNDNFSMLMSGVASKTGYNWELADGKFIIQPSYLMSYSFVNTFDYTNAAGVRINSDPLHAIQIEPGLKFIGNLKNGWQPYVGVSMVWNIMDKTDFMANNVALPELSVKPFVRYGLGVRKTWGERCTGFLQTFFMGGGRNGVGLQGGFRWTLGKKHSVSHYQNSELPELMKTELNLSSIK